MFIIPVCERGRSRTAAFEPRRDSTHTVRLFHEYTSTHVLCASGGGAAPYCPLRPQFPNLKGAQSVLGHPDAMTLTHQYRSRLLPRWLTMQDQLP